MADQTFGVNCGFWDAVNYDRKYSADDMNKPYSRIIADGVFAANDGTPSSDLQVIASGSNMNVTVQKGQGIFAHKWFENPSSLLIAVPENTALYSRIDSVIAQVDKRTSGRVGNIVYRTGTAAPTPEAPEINATASVVEYRIANITVAPSASAVSQAEITDLRGSAACPWVTSLIQQVDTSTLWAQFQAAYQAQYDRYTTDFLEYTEEQRQAWEDFLASLTEELTVSTSVVTFSSVHVTEAEEDEIPIGVASYNHSTDVLQVYINGLLATEGVDYTLSEDYESVDLATALEEGQTVVCIVFKSIVAGGIESATSLIQRLDSKVDGFVEDSGWLALALEGDVEEVDSDAFPAVRAIGSRVYLRGCIKGVDAADTLIATLPVSMKPGIDVVFTTSAVSTLGVVNPVTVTVEAASGDITVSAVGTIAATDTISIAFSFLANYSSNAAMVFRYCGSVDTYDDLPTSGIVAGDVYMILSADAEHYISAGDSVLWNGAEWEVVSMTISSAEIDGIIGSIE